MSTSGVGTIKIGDAVLRVTSVSLAGGAFVVRAAGTSTTVIAAGTQPMQLLGRDGQLIAAGTINNAAPITSTARKPASVIVRVTPSGELSPLKVQIVEPSP